MAKLDLKAFLANPDRVIQDLKATATLAAGGDPRAYLEDSAREVLSSMAPAAQLALVDASTLHSDLTALQGDVDRTMAAIEAESDPRRLAALKEDLVKALASRKASIELKARAALASDVRAALEAALATFVTIASAFAKAFVPALGNLGNLGK